MLMGAGREGAKKAPVAAGYIIGRYRNIRSPEGILYQGFKLQTHAAPSYAGRLQRRILPSDTK